MTRCLTRRARAHSLPRLLGAGLVVLMAACGAEPAPTEESLQAGLVAWWRFDEGHGQAASDASGNGNTVTLQGGIWAPGVSGTALAMDGGDDDIATIDHSDSLARTRSAISVSAWAWRDAQHNVALVAHDYPNLFFGFHGAQYKWQVRNGWERLAGCYADPRHRAESGRWLHVVGTYSGFRVRLYANGELVCQRWQIGAIEMGDQPWTLSGYLNRQGAIVDEITGRMDEVRIYERALTESEVRALYQLGRTRVSGE